MKIVSVITARGGSKGIPDKNIIIKFMVFGEYKKIEIQKN